MKNQKYRKLLASVLVCSMILGNVPAAVYAESDVRMQEVQEQQQEEASVDTEGTGMLWILKKTKMRTQQEAMKVWRLRQTMQQGR